MAESKHQDAVEAIAELSRRSATLAARSSDAALSRQSFLARLDRELVSPPRQWNALRSWALAGALGAIAAWFVLFRAPALTFSVNGAELSGQYVRATERAPATLRFSDASSIAALPGSRLRIEETNPRGARVLLERGQASVRIVHRSSTAWTFAAGPFEVHVTGTRFELGWDPARETCDLVLQEGSVEVRGPGGVGPVVLRGGQRFQGDARLRTMQVLELEPVVVPSAAPSSSAAQLPNTEATEPLVGLDAGAVVGKSLPEASARPEPHPNHWAQLIAHGKFREIVRDAEGRGISGCLVSCSAADLHALSDAARYTGNGPLAERTLLALRQRFPGREGADAAFLLGRLQEQRGALGVAQTWYDRYLLEVPSGAFSAEALAGKLRAIEATSGKQAAQPVAREYLARFPQGVHADLAREILRSK